MTDDAAVLSIIIVTWNTREALEACLRSLRRHGPEAAHEIIVVDNASADGTAGLVRAGFPEVHLIEAPRNLGFAGGNNLGAQAAGGRFLLFLNSDTEATPGVFDAMLRVFEAHRTDAEPLGAVGCRVRYPDGRVQRSARRLPTFAAALHQYSLLKYAQVLRRAETRQKMASFGFDVEQPVDTLMGAAVMVDRRAYEAVGGWDEAYPFGYEDVDFSLRLRQAGYVLLFSPCGEVIHYGGTATKKMRRRRRTLFRGMFRFFRRSRGRVATLGFKALFVPLYAARLVVDCPVQAGRTALYLLRGEGDRARLRWRGLVEDLRSLTTDVWQMWWW